MLQADGRLSGDRKNKMCTPRVKYLEAYQEWNVLERPEGFVPP